MLDDRMRETRVELAALAEGARRLCRAQEELHRAVGGFVEHVPPDTETHSASPALTARVQALAERVQQLTRIEDQLNQRLDHLAEGVARAAESERQRLGAVESQVREAVDGLADRVEWQRLEWHEGFGQRLGELRTAITEAETSTAVRLRVLEEHVTERQAEVSELKELQFVLDGGLGQLRSEMAALRDAKRALAEGQAEVTRRLDTLAAVQVAATDERSGVKRRGRWAEVAVRIAALAATTEELVRDHQQMKAQLAMLEHAAEAAAGEAARASSQASALAPLQLDVRALHDQLTSQNEALATLAKSVERLRRRIAAQEPEAKRPPRGPKI
jgi:DNA anti-recombination protein RmuC